MVHQIQTCVINTFLYCYLATCSLAACIWAHPSRVRVAHRHAIASEHLALHTTPPCPCQQCHGLPSASSFCFLEACHTPTAGCLRGPPPPGGRRAAWQLPHHCMLRPPPPVMAWIPPMPMGCRAGNGSTRRVSAAQAAKCCKNVGMWGAIVSMHACVCWGG